MDKRILSLKEEVKDVLTSNILPFWIDNMVDKRGGFYGRIDGNNTLIPENVKGAVLNARILWTFSAAYRIFKKDEYLKMATRAKNVIINEFYDNKYGGIFWALDFKGNPFDTKKQIYALGFAIYGLSEYYRATKDPEALKYAVKLFESIEEYSFDNVKNGYCEALRCDWKEIEDMRLSDKDENERKTMNTHLHILEPYTNLYKVWKDERLARQIRNLIDIFIDKIIDKNSSHLQLFFDDDWNSKYDIVSYGHDIEASWLIHEAALVLADKELIDKVSPFVKSIASAASEGLDNAGRMIYEKKNATNEIDSNYHWWVQAETVVGYINIYQYFNDESALQKALNCWNFIRNNLIDYENGEWWWSVDKAGVKNKNDDKAGFWKCPYHNSRMCMEIIERFNK